MIPEEMDYKDGKKRQKTNKWVLECIFRITEHPFKNLHCSDTEGLR